MPLFVYPGKVTLGCCADESIKDYWLAELKEAGIAVSLLQQNNPALLLKKTAILLLIKPDFEQVQNFTLKKNKFLSGEAEHFFIISNDERWRNINTGKNFFCLPEHTHPMEVARFMVEKLNFPILSNKTHYAFSLFSF